MSRETAAARPAWEIENYLTAHKGRLRINGADATELAQTHGTPLFVFSAPRILSNIKQLQDAAANAPRPARFFYAAKANSNMAILRTVLESGIDLEVNSGGELFKALRVGFRPDQIIFNGTSKTPQELDEAVSAGILSINADSVYELELIEEAARRAEKRANVTLRLVPEIGTRTHAGLQTALLTSKFGISSSEAQTAFRRALVRPELINLCGVHIHVGSQTPDAAPYAEAFRVLWRHLVWLYHEAGHKLSYVNIGGGLPVNYLRDNTQAGNIHDEERDMLGANMTPREVLQATFDAARAVAQEAEAEHLLENLTILMEPGRSVIADAGLVLTTVRNVKTRPETGDTWLLTDAGYNILLSMNNYKWYYHLISAARADAAHNTDYKVAGPLCDGGDVYFDIEGAGRLPDHRRLPPDAQPGEVLALLNAGAYSLAQMFPYNGRPLPAAVLVKDGNIIELIRRRDSYEDLLTNDLW
jgi:diaminopimelate decarboxylase